uniref:Uncharacterized protein n=1 Tax=Cacopsylla melanoneura TaxID=428564 RepID=A0A8D8Z8Q5_9HEMI
MLISLLMVILCPEEISVFSVFVNYWNWSESLKFGLRCLVRTQVISGELESFSESSISVSWRVSLCISLNPVKELKAKFCLGYLRVKFIVFTQVMILLHSGIQAFLLVH